MWNSLQQPPIQPAQLNDRFFKTYIAHWHVVLKAGLTPAQDAFKAFSCKTRATLILHAKIVYLKLVSYWLAPNRKG